MVSLLLIISFLLHLISIYAIYQLFQYMKTRQQAADEIAALFETYLQAFKEENELLKDKLQNRDGNGVSASPLTDKDIQEEIEAERGTNRHDSESFTMPTIDIQDEVEASLESKVLQLASEGFAPDAIAKKLNCGKTEVELIVKLYKKSNTNA